jgi:excisionase family DNA binding protein
METEPLRVSEAARRLGVTTKTLLELINDRKIEYVMIDGIAHVREDAIERFRRARAS